MVNAKNSDLLRLPKGNDSTQRFNKAKAWVNRTKICLLQKRSDGHDVELFKRGMEEEKRFFIL